MGLSRLEWAGTKKGAEAMGGSVSRRLAGLEPPPPIGWWIKKQGEHTVPEGQLECSAAVPASPPSVGQ